MSFDKQTDLCTCGHSRAAHFEASSQACSRGDCICASFDKVDPVRAAAPDMLEALKAVSDAFYRESLVEHRGDVMPKVWAAIKKAES